MKLFNSATRKKEELVPVHEGQPLKYYRENGVHYVPKITADDLIL